MYCPKCGAHNPDNHEICESCGLKFGSAVRKSVYDPVTNTYKPLPITLPSIPGKGMGVAAMVLGILSIVFCWALFISLPLAVIGVTLGGMGNSKANTIGVRNGCAVAGIVCSCITLGILLTSVIILVAEGYYIF